MGFARELGIEREDGPVQLTAEDEVPVYVPAGQAALGDMRAMPRSSAAQCQPVQRVRGGVEGARTIASVADARAERARAAACSSCTVHATYGAVCSGDAISAGSGSAHPCTTRLSRTY